MTTKMSAFSLLPPMHLRTNLPLSFAAWQAEAPTVGSSNRESRQKVRRKGKMLALGGATARAGPEGRCRAFPSSGTGILGRFVTFRRHG